MYVYVNDLIGLKVVCGLFECLSVSLISNDAWLYIFPLVGIITARIQHLSDHMRKYKKVNPN